MRKWTRDDYVNTGTGLVLLSFCFLVACIIASGGVLIMRAVW